MGWDLRRDRHLLGDGPHEREELTCDGGRDDVGMLAAGEEPAVSTNVKKLTKMNAEKLTTLSARGFRWG